MSERKPGSTGALAPPRGWAVRGPTRRTPCHLPCREKKLKKLIGEEGTETHVALYKASRGPPGPVACARSDSAGSSRCLGPCAFALLWPCACGSSVRACRAPALAATAPVCAEPCAWPTGRACPAPLPCRLGTSPTASCASRCALPGVSPCRSALRAVTSARSSSRCPSAAAGMQSGPVCHWASCRLMSPAARLLLGPAGWVRLEAVLPRSDPRAPPPLPPRRWT